MIRSARSVALRLSVAILCGAALGACGIACAPPPPVARPYPAPSAQEILDHLASRLSSVKTQRVDARVEYAEASGQHAKIKMSFLTAAPDHLRIQADSPLGGAVASLATDGKSFQLLDTRNNRFLDGDASPCNLARLIRVELSPADVVTVLAGGAPLLPGANAGDAEVSWDPSGGGREVLTLHAGGATQVLKLSPRERGFDLLESEPLSPSGAVRYRLTNDDYSDDHGARMPARASITDPARAAEIHLRYGSRELNPEPPADAFHLDAPAGIPVETVRCD